VTFYHDYRKAPAGRHVLKLCQAEACQSMGSRRRRGAGQAGARHRLPRDDEADGAVTLEPVYCLGLCACAPSAMLDGEVIGRLGRVDAT
jgi:formate dehydrogenase subunit gamma